MITLKDIKNKIEENILALATSDKNSVPHNIAVMYAKVIDDKIIITNNFMKKTIENIKLNNKVSLVLWEKEEGWRIDGVAEYFDNGKWLESVKKIKENKDMPCRGALVIGSLNISKLCG